MQSQQQREKAHASGVLSSRVVPTRVNCPPGSSPDTHRSGTSVGRSHRHLLPGVNRTPRPQKKAVVSVSRSVGTARARWASLAAGGWEPSPGAQTAAPGQACKQASLEGAVPGLLG